MATREQRARLLAVSCPWCGSAPGEVCVLRAAKRRDHEGGERRRRLPVITTLDGGCHDARWQKALGMPAPVLAAAVQQLREPGSEGLPEGPAVDEVAAGLARPW